MTRYEGSRRIDPTANKEANRENKLKAVAGLIQCLSYREMQKLTRMLAPTSGADELAEKLLEVADQILTEKEYSLAL